MLQATQRDRRTRSHTIVAMLIGLGLGVAGFLAPVSGIASPQCVIPDNGTGTGDLPPNLCAYDDDTDTFKIIDGLPPGTEIHSDGQIEQFFNVLRNPGGSLGGEIEQYQAFLQLDMNGTGTLAGYHRNLAIQLSCQTHAAPRVLGAPVQSFATDYFQLQGQIVGDPDFDLLRITAGTNFGMPSPGHTTLTKIPATTNWNVDSFFDITYRIDFVGHPGSPLSGRSGSTTATIRMQCGQPTNPTGIAAGSWGKLKIHYR